MSEMVRAPEQFRPYPTPGGPMHGTVEVDLGEWFDGESVERLHLRISVADLPKLVATLCEKNGYVRTLGYGAFDVFFVAPLRKRPATAGDTPPPPAPAAPSAPTP